MKKRILSLMMAMIMVFSLLPVNVLAAGTAEDPYDIGDIVIGETAPIGVIPENTEWIRSDVPAVYAETTECTTEHEHSVAEGCYAVVTAAFVQWTLMENIAPINEEAKQHAEGCTLAADHEGDCVLPKVHAEGCTLAADHEGDCVLPKVHAEGCILAASHEGDCYVCEEGCILEGTAEHEENGWECFVWEACTLTEGCELANGHEGECTGAALLGGVDEYGRLPIHFFLASPGNITNPNGSYTNYYAATNASQDTGWQAWATADIKTRNTDHWRQMYTQNGIRNTTDEDLIISYVDQWPQGSSDAFKDFGSVTINGTTYRDTEYEIKWVSIMCRDNAHSSSGMRCQQRNYEGEHIHIDGLLVKKIVPGTMNIHKAIPEAAKVNTTFNFTLEKMYQASTTSGPQNIVDPDFKSITLSATIAAGDMEAVIQGGENITFGYYRLTELPTSGWENNGILFDPTTGSNYSRSSNVLYVNIAPNGTVQYCDTLNGTYRTMDKVTVQNKRGSVSVNYEWRLYDGSGNYVAMPVGITPPLPEAQTGIQYGSNYVYDTEYVNGTSFINPQTGEMYTFHGWDTYSHSNQFNVVPSTGYIELDDNDTVASNNQTISMTADTYIYGYWTVKQLPPASAHIAVEKVFMLDGVDVTANLVNTPIASAAGLWFRIDPGIDKDNDGMSQVDIDYPAIVAQDGEYKLPVYQYDKPFTFTEHVDDIPGYSRTTTIAVTGENASLIKADGDYAEVAMTEVYEGENIHLGTITYTNSYTKNVGTPVSEYPTLALGKLGTDNGNQAGAVFTLYSDAQLTNVVGTYTIPASGMVDIDFSGKAAGTYYLKETTAPNGYHLDPHVYTIQMTAGEPVEELRNGEFVQVTYYTLVITKPEASTAAIAAARAGNTYSLTVYNEPILGQISISKNAMVGQQEMAAADKAHLNATVIIRGPITRDTQKNITALGNTYTLNLNSENNWMDSLINLPIGEYLIHESFASVHGFTWNDEVYMVGNEALTEATYNNMKYVLLTIDSSDEIKIDLTNHYEEWNAADFYIKKVDEANKVLGGAEFTLYSDEDCENKLTGENITLSAITDEYGYAYFKGYEVDVNENDGIETYYLQESKAPVGYYLDSTVYKVDIKAVKDATTNKITYEPKISITNDAGEWVEANFDKDTDLLTVTNEAIKGKLTITKEFANNVVPEGMASVDITVTGPNNYNKTFALNAANKWEVTLSDLALGTYTITESNAQVPGYDLKVDYSARAVTLADEQNGKTEPGTVVSDSVTVTNTYTRNDEYFEVPTALNILKVDENGQPLAGAVFTLTRTSDGRAMTFTTGADGKAMFDMLAGTMGADGKPVNTYGATEFVLKEEIAPSGYVKAQEEWKIIVQEDDGELRVKLNSDKNVFENFWDWILNKDSNYIWTNDGVLTVKNTKVLGELTVTKTQTGGYAANEVTVNVSGPNGYSNSVKLNSGNGWTETLTGLELGEYSVNEAALNLDGTGYSYSVAMKDTDGNVSAGSDVDGEVLLDITEHRNHVVNATVEITNTYTKVTGDDVHVYPDFKVYKTDDQRNPLAGASFQLAGANLPQNLVLSSDNNGIVSFPALKPGTYTLTELSAPAGYAKDDSVYQVVVSVKDGYPVEQLVNGKHIMRYEYAIAVTKSGAAVSITNNTLTVMNHKVSGELIITKSFGANTATKPAAIYVTVTGPNSFSKEYTLNDTNNWTVKLTDLALGNYVVREKDATIPGYTLTASMQDTDGKVTYGSAVDGRVALAVGDLEAGFTKAVVSSTVAITNNYEKNTVNEAEVLPDLNVYKLRTGTNNVLLDGAQFVLTGPNGYSKTGTTANGGNLVFEDLKPGAYTLKETVAPAGYAVTENTYSFEVVEVSNTGEILQADGTWLNTYTYDIKEITDTNEAVEVRFIDDSNTLAVFNSVNEGSITITKDFGVDSKLNAEVFADKQFTFKILKADGSAAVDMDGKEVAPVTVSKETNWTVTVTNLPLGKYQVVEVTDGSDNQGHVIKDNMYEYENNAYTWTVAYDPNGGIVDITADDEHNTVAVTNTFSFITPGRLDVKKVDASTGKALEGAKFALYKANETFEKLSETALVTYTTTADGIASFSGFLVDGYYVLEEVTAPTNYNKAEKHTWNVQIVRYYTDDAQTAEAVKFIIDKTEHASNELTLEVANTRSVGNLVINKAVQYVDETGNVIDKPAFSEEDELKYNPESYEFKVTILDDNNAYWNGYNAKEVTVLANGKDHVVVENIPYGYIYSVQEVTTDAVFTAQVTKDNGKIGAKNVVNATNTYTIITEAPGLNIVKHEDGAAKVIAGAQFALYSDRECNNEIAKGITDADGKLNLPLNAVGTFYLKETKAADGYHENDAVYTITTKYIYENDTVNKVVKQSIVVDKDKFDAYSTMKLTNPNADPADYEFHVINTAIKPVILSAEKEWIDDNYYARPDSITVKLYKDDKSTAAVEKELHSEIVLNASNNWHHVWNGGIAAGLTDEYNWTVEEAAVAGYTASFTEEDGHWIITNTRETKQIKLDVKKDWNHNNHTDYMPKSILVQLFRDDVAYGQPVELNAENNWSYSWATANDANINDAHKWTVRELVPAGYEDGYTTTIDGQQYLVQDGTLKITNTRIVLPVTVTVNKEWDIAVENVATPEFVTVNLLKDGVEVAEVQLSEKNNWKHEWSGEVNGVKMLDTSVWTVTEDKVENYSTEIKEVEVLNRDKDGVPESRSYNVDITNTFELGRLIVSKTVDLYHFNEDAEPEKVENDPAFDGFPVASEYNFVLTYGDETIEFALKDGETKEFFVPLGVEYAVSEVLPQDHYWNVALMDDSDNMEDVLTVEDAQNTIAVNNIYYFHDVAVTEELEAEHEALFFAEKIDAETKEIIGGAKFGVYFDEECTDLMEEVEVPSGIMEIHFTEAGTYYLKELVAPEGYHLSDKVYKLEVTEEFTTYREDDDVIVLKRLIVSSDDMDLVDGKLEGIFDVYEILNVPGKELDLSVEKRWVVPDGYTAIPEYVEVQLYRDGEKYGDPVKLNKDNNWKHEWSGEEYLDVYNWEIAEINVPKGYDSKVITEDGLNVVVVNTLKYGFTNVSVSKIWLNPKDYDKQPTTVTVVLYRDGEPYDTVVLAESNGWHYKWKDLPDCFTWTVDEPNVPKDYAKKVTHIGNAWVITNAHKDIPLTGDDNSVLLWAGATGVAVVGLGASLVMLLKKRKEEDEQA